MELSLVPFFCDADARGREDSKRVYVTVVGVGLGVWAKKRELQVREGEREEPGGRLENEINLII